MNRKQHILICGEVGVGKSTLIQRLLAHSSRPRYGFITKKLEPDENDALIAHRECGSLRAAADRLGISMACLRILLQRAHHKIERTLDRTDPSIVDRRPEDESHAV